MNNTVKFAEVECDFSYKHFIECINNALNKGYTFLKFSENNKVSKYDKVIFFRHDVDFDVELALKMAEIENKQGINSTYFIRVLGRYNVWNINVFKSIKKIMDLGHEIGLHYEEDFSVLNNRDFVEDFEFHKLMLEKLLKIYIKSFAPHEPINTKSMNLPKRIIEKFDVIEAYNNFFFRECKYISDSGSRWREGCMHDFIKNETKRLCILTHPIFWYDKSPIENY